MPAGPYAYPSSIKIDTQGSGFQLAWPRLVDVTRANNTKVRLLAPTFKRVLTLHHEWMTPAEYALLLQHFTDNAGLAFTLTYRSVGYTVLYIDDAIKLNEQRGYYYDVTVTFREQ
jgi:hypothetical protein